VAGRGIQRVEANQGACWHVHSLTAAPACVRDALPELGIHQRRATRQNERYTCIENRFRVRGDGVRRRGLDNHIGRSGDQVSKLCQRRPIARGIASYEHSYQLGFGDPAIEKRASYMETDGPEPDQPNPQSQRVASPMVST
jgi:hypothetical protein